MVLTTVQEKGKHPFVNYSIYLPPNPEVNRIFIGLPSDVEEMELGERGPILFDRKPFRNNDIVHYILKANSMGVKPYFIIPEKTLDEDSFSEHGIRKLISERTNDSISSIVKFRAEDIKKIAVRPFNGGYSTFIGSLTDTFQRVVGICVPKGSTKEMHPIIKKCLEEREDDFARIYSDLIESVNNTIWKIQEENIVLGVEVGYVESLSFSGFVLLSCVLNKGEKDCEIVFFLDISRNNMHMEMSLWSLVEKTAEEVWRIFPGIFSTLLKVTPTYGTKESYFIEDIAKQIEKEIIKKDSLTIRFYINTDDRGLLLSSLNAIEYAVTRDLNGLLVRGISGDRENVEKEIKERKSRAMDYYRL